MDNPPPDDSGREDKLAHAKRKLQKFQQKRRPGSAPGSQSGYSIGGSAMASGLQSPQILESPLDGESPRMQSHWPAAAAVDLPLTHVGSTGSLYKGETADAMLQMGATVTTTATTTTTLAAPTTTTAAVADKEDLLMQVSTWVMDHLPTLPIPLFSPSFLCFFLP